MRRASMISPAIPGFSTAIVGAFVASTLGFIALVLV